MFESKPGRWHWHLAESSSWGGRPACTQKHPWILNQLPCFPDIHISTRWNRLVLLPLPDSCHQRIRIPCPKCHSSIMFHKIFQKSYLSFFIVQLSFWPTGLCKMEFLEILRSSRFPSVGRWNKTVSKFMACLAWSRAFKASKCLEGHRDPCWTMKCDRNVRTTHLLAAWRSMAATPVVLSCKIIGWEHREAIHVFASQLSLLDGSLRFCQFDCGNVESFTR